MRERCTDRCAMHRVWPHDGSTIEPRHQPGGLSIEEAPQGARAIGLRRWRLHAGMGKMRHEIQVERQFLGGQALVEREHIAALVGGDEVVGIFYAGGDGLESLNRAERIAAEPGGELFRGNGGIDRHRAAAATRRRAHESKSDGRDRFRTRTTATSESSGPYPDCRDG